MVIVGGIVGAILGVAIAAFFTEVVFANDAEWPIIFLGVGVAGGYLVGSALARRLARRNPAPS